MNPPRLVVRTHDPKRAATRLALAAAVTAAALLAAFVAGRMAADADRRAARAAEAALADATTGALALREQLAVAERSGQVDREAHAQLRQTLAGLNGEILQLREELAFYRGIVSPADARRGVRVHDLSVEGAGDTWRYTLMLIQAMQHDRQAEGTAHLTLVGTGADGPQRVAVAADGVAYDFRYFQPLDGDILLPQGFIPERIEVELRPRSTREDPVQQAFDWPGAIKVGG